MLAPVLRPIRDGLYRLVGRPVPRPRWPPLPTADPASGEAPSPIRAMTRDEFVELRSRFRYYRARDRYMSRAAWEVTDLIERYGLRSALELGPHIRPLVHGADVMELRPSPDLESTGRLIVHNATIAPWPIEDGAYDLFVALQVFEHLGKGQPEAFREVCRVARHAVISLPIDWVMKDPTNSHHQIPQERVLGWFAPRVPTRIVEGNPAPGKRMIYVFEHLDRPVESQAP